MNKDIEQLLMELTSLNATNKGIEKELRLANEVKKAEVTLKFMELLQNNGENGHTITNLDEIGKKLGNNISNIEKELFGEVRNKED